MNRVDQYQYLCMVRVMLKFKVEDDHHHRKNNLPTLHTSAIYTKAYQEKSPMLAFFYWLIVFSSIKK